MDLAGFRELTSESCFDATSEVYASLSREFKPNYKRELELQASWLRNRSLELDTNLSEIKCRIAKCGIGVDATTQPKVHAGLDNLATCLTAQLQLRCTDARTLAYPLDR